MRHRHAGPKVMYRTRRNNIRYRNRPTHKVRPKWEKYNKLVRKAQGKGYKVTDLNRRNLTVDEVDIPEVYLTDGIIVPDHRSGKRRDLVFIDDDAIPENKRKAFAHELGHQHLFVTKQDDETINSNDPKIERKADKIGADILGMSVKKFNSPDATYNDVREKVRRGFFSEREEDSMSEEEEIVKQAIEKEGREAVEQDPEDVETITKGVKEDIDAGIDKEKKSRWRGWADED